jgi:hypothetical protein
MSTLNVTAAATEAHVTAETVRAWCRRGVVAATKIAGRWVISAASLAHRIAIAAMKAPRKVAAWTVETMTAIGGRLWEKNGMRRVYLNDWQTFAGLELTHYGTGNISSATYQGAGISNSQAYKLAGAIEKVWFDTEDGKLHCRLGSGQSSRVATHTEVWEAVVAGVRTALAAL